MDVRNIPCFGQHVLVQEITTDSNDVSSLEGKSVKIIGRLLEHDITKCTAKVSDSRSSEKCVHISTKLIEPFPAVLGSLFQFIGELDCLSDEYDIILIARVVRCVDGLDMTLYGEALNRQRKYFEDRTK